MARVRIPRATWMANRALRELPAFAKVEAQVVIDGTAFQVWRGAQQRVAVRTGFLKRRLQWQSRPRTTRAVVVVDRDAYYWRMVEYVRPFLRPAAEAQAGAHARDMVKALQRAATAMARTVTVRASGAL